MRQMMILGVMLKVMNTLIQFLLAYARAWPTFMETCVKDVFYLVNFMVGKTSAGFKLVERLAKFVA